MKADKKMKSIEKRIDELDNIVAQCLTNNKPIPEEVRKEHKELSSIFNGMVSEIIQEKTEEFLNIIKKES